MRVKFNQAVRLPSGPNGKDYSRGTHEVPEEVLKHSFFHKLIKAGLVEDGEAAQVVSPLSLQERQKQLAERLAASSKVSALEPPRPANSEIIPSSDSPESENPPKTDDELLVEMEAQEAFKKAKTESLKKPNRKGK